MMDVSGMAPEDAFIEGIRAALQMTASQGRNGDSQLAHVTPDEAEMLKARGGAGTRNPQTGLPEFFETDMGRERGRDSGVGGPDRGAAGGGNRDDDVISGGGADTTLGRGPVDTVGIGQDGRVTTATNPTSAGGSANPTGDAASSDNRTLGERFVDGIVAAATGGNRFGPPTGEDPGFLGTAVGMLPGIGWGMSLTNALHGMGFESTPEYDDRLGDSNREQRDDRILSPRPQQQQKPKPTQQHAWQRPGQAPQAPGGLNFDPAMTPLQQRAAVATGGTNADAGIYRDPAVQEYYRNLALYSLLGPNNKPAQGAQVLPIERQYISQVTGAQPGESLDDFLRALNGLQF